jgi:3-hydroxymyristoyl/3-hydroxydecanoyl-(acyl carrier protein) dehydratase
MDGKFYCSVPVDHPAFPGHFPEHPIVPGVLLLDEALQGIGLALGWPEAPGQIANCKFLSPVKPGEALCIAYRCQPNGTVLFEIRERLAIDEDKCGRLVASGKFVAPAKLA